MVIDNSDKIILDLCGGTGSWSNPYREAGYGVRNITLPENDVRLFEFPEEPIHGILAAPPCEEFSYVKHFHGKGKYSHNFKEGLIVVDACLRIILMTKPKWWVLENPANYLRRWLGEPVIIFNPWQYGSGYQKRTALWGDFTVPEFTVTEKPKDIKKFSALKSIDIAPEYYGKLPRHIRRAITPKEFARAFYESNK